MRKKAKVMKRKSKKAPAPIVVPLTIDRELKEKLERIAFDAYTDIPTVCQVLLSTGMHMGGNAKDQALKDTVAHCMDLEAKLCRCRQVMEANDPGNALDIFGPPVVEPAKPAEAPVPPETEPASPMPDPNEAPPP